MSTYTHTHTHTRAHTHTQAALGLPVGGSSRPKKSHRKVEVSDGDMDWLDDEVGQTHSFVELEQMNSIVELNYHGFYTMHGLAYFIFCVPLPDRAHT